VLEGEIPVERRENTEHEELSKIGPKKSEATQNPDCCRELQSTSGIRHPRRQPGHIVERK
jgi:hypothetical protein